MLRQVWQSFDFLRLSADVLPANSTTEKPEGQVPVDVRLCKECNHTLFSKRDFAAEVMQKPPSVRAYENLFQFERGIRTLLPKFQKLLFALQDPDKPPTTTQLAEAAKVRKRLMDSFTQYDIAARRIRDLPTDSPTQQKLQKAVHQQSTNFLHLHMLPLKTLPKILKHATPHGSKSGMQLANGRPTSALASIKYNNDVENFSQLSSEQSSQISALEAEEKQLKERLIVLEEQKFFVQEMVADANKKRKFDEVAALAGNVEEISKEIDGVQNMLAGLDFEGAYTGLGSPRPKPVG
jgi:rabenosyn-5